MTPSISAFQAGSDFALDVRAGLTRARQKKLPSKCFYDDRGSALFEAIRVLPEYGLTRADERLLRSHSAHVAAHLDSPLMVVEQGFRASRDVQ